MFLSMKSLVDDVWALVHLVRGFQATRSCIIMMRWGWWRKVWRWKLNKAPSLLMSFSDSLWTEWNPVERCGDYDTRKCKKPIQFPCSARSTDQCLISWSNEETSVEADWPRFETSAPLRLAVSKVALEPAVPDTAQAPWFYHVHHCRWSRWLRAVTVGLVLKSVGPMGRDLSIHKMHWPWRYTWWIIPLSK